MNIHRKNQVITDDVIDALAKTSKGRSTICNNEQNPVHFFIKKQTKQ